MGLDPRFAPLHQPVHDFVFAQVTPGTARPLVLGLQAPQGAGKTTLVTHLLRRLEHRGLRAAGVSIDDFYLTRTEQLALATDHPDNRYLEHRGYPGTHDIGLGVRTLRALREIRPRDHVPVPVYDKSAHGGRGDRAPEQEWRTVDGPLDLVVVEGWMLGFTPVLESQLPDQQLAAPNSALANYAEWYGHIDRWIVLRAAEPEFVLEWRVEAEERMKAAGKPGLSRDAIEDYVRRFLPAYRTYANGLAANREPDLAITLGLDRIPL